MLKKKIIIVALILITAITAIIMFSNFGGNTSKSIDPVTQKPIAAKIGDNKVIVQGQWLGDFNDLTKTGKVLVNGVAHKVEYLDEGNDRYALRNVKQAEDGKYVFTNDPAETAFVINGTANSKDKDLVQVSTAIQPTITLHGTVTEQFFTYSVNKTFRVNGQDVPVVRGEGNSFTLATPARAYSSYTINIASEDDTIFAFYGDDPSIKNPDLTAVLEVGDIKLVPMN